ncbi:MAG: hypothetical protein KBA15_02600 [Spirochaetes bacterium]|jgi:5'-nucleotidase|nr:hypothetical protein [Spirochaetota bacterium]
MRLYRLLLAAAIITAATPTVAGSAPPRVTIVYTNSLNGNLDYCRCPSDPKGGLVKRATEIEAIRKTHENVILLDTGDFLTIDGDPLLARHVLDAYRVIGYDALLPGDQEFSAGTNFFIAHSKGLPLVAANLQVMKGGAWTYAFPRSLLIERGGVKIGLTGVISPAAFRYYPKKVTEGIRVLEASSAALEEAAALRKRGAELVILLSHSGFEADLELEKTTRGVDVIVGGHSQTLVKEPHRGRSAVVVQAGANGAHIGILELALPPGGPRVLKNSFRTPDEHRPADDPRIRRIIERYNAELKSRYEKARPK